MIHTRSIRLRMMLLFCAVAGLLLVGSHLALYVVFVRVVRAQLDRRLLETAAPLVSDLIADQSEQDVNQLNIPDDYFELLDTSGRVVEHSRNLQVRLLDISLERIDVSQTVFSTIEDAERGQLRLALIPFRWGTELRVLAIATPTRDTEQALWSFRWMILLLLPTSLLLTATISAWYASRSLRPIADLTRRAAEISQQVSQGLPDSIRRNFQMSLPGDDSRDELGLLAETFSKLFAQIDRALVQLRQFVSDASHELRTPLSVLQGETELLLSEPRTSEEYRKTLRVIDGELKKLSRIVESLFTLSMADAGQLHLMKEPLYLEEVLEETCGLASPLAQGKGITITREFKQGVACLGDGALLRQLFLIFLENGIKYSPPGTSVRVVLETTGRGIQVQFRDQGFGISSEHLPHIFERFYRAGQPTGETHSGGLGLSIAQAIVRAHDGSIECDSEPGKGSTFTVYLPLSLLMEEVEINRN